MMTSAPDFGKKLIDTMNSGDAANSLYMLQEFQKYMRDPALGAEFVVWITEPVNLSSVQKSLINYLGISPRALAIKRLLMSRTQKAALMIQAMEIALKRTHGL